MTAIEQPGRDRSTSRPTVGVFALQGDCGPHRDTLRRAGLTVRDVRAAADLNGLDGLVMPGGESTTMLRLLRITGLEQPLRTFLERRSVPVLATCAGVILLARSVLGPTQHSFGVLDLEVERNGYGRQVHSGTFDLQWSAEAIAEFAAEGVETAGARGVFIRAPRIVAVGEGVRVLASRDGDPVLVDQDGVLGCGFHPELERDHPVCRLFAARVERRARTAPSTFDRLSDGAAVGAG